MSLGYRGIKLGSGDQNRSTSRNGSSQGLDCETVLRRRFLVVDRTGVMLVLQTRAFPLSYSGMLTKDKVFYVANSSKCLKITNPKIQNRIATSTIKAINLSFVIDSVRFILFSCF